MIDQMELHQFQSHSDTVIDFDSGVNVITGSSDSGKSALMRFMLWIITNRPLGDEFRSWYAAEKDTVNGGIAFSEGAYVLKERIKGKNIYDVNGTTLEALKSDVPDELKLITNLADYNIQTQHQPYFLLQDTPGEVARKLNELIGLDVIDTIFANLNRSIRELNRENLTLDNQINSLSTQIESLSFLDEIQAIVNKLEQEVISKEQIESESRGLHSVISSIEDLNRQISEIEIDPSLEKDVVNLLSSIKDCQEQQKNLAVFYGIVNNLKEIDETIIAETEWLEVEEPSLEITALLSEHKTLLLNKVNLTTTLSGIFIGEKTIETEQLNLETLLSSLENLLKKAKVCPFCYTPITNETIKHIEDHL